MYKSSIISSGLHLVIFFFAYYGLPEVKKNKFKEIPVDIVLDLPKAKTTNLKKISKYPLQKNKRTVKSSPKQRQISSSEKPKIEKVIKPIKKKKQITEKLTKKPISKKKIIKAKAKIDIPKVLPKRKQRNSKQKKEMARGILRNLEKAQIKSKAETKTKKVDDFKNKLLAAVNSNTEKKVKKIETLSNSEIQILRNHVSQFFSAPFSAKAIENIGIVLLINTNLDGTVTRVEIIDKSKYLKSPIFRASADAARRAVKDSSPLPLPKDKFDQWRSFTFTFYTNFIKSNS